MADVDLILQKIDRQSAFWSDTYSKVLPGVVATRTWGYSRINVFMHTLLLRSTLLFLSFFCRRKVPKYVFQGLRYRALIETLPASDVMVIGGRSEYLYCREKGYRFHCIGYIAKSFQLYMGTGKKEAEVLSRAVCFLRDFFSIPAGEHAYLFLGEDSLPAGIVLSATLGDIPGLSVACIAHGYFPRYYGNIVHPEGAFCKFNLVWDESQRKLFREGDDPATFALGLPYEVVPPQAISREIVLVGHCGLLADTTEYLYSLHHFHTVFTIFKRAGYTVTFRPHPQDDIEFVSSIFSSVRRENKLDLFNSARRIFIGFASSLMYEASQFGNVIVVLDGASIFPYKMDYQVDAVVSEADYGQLPLLISNLLDAMPLHADAESGSLSTRFQSCIKQIDAFESNFS